MGRLVLSVLNGFGARQLAAELPSHEAVKDFVEWRIEELLAQGARYVVVADDYAHIETHYDAASIADCVFVGAKDWRHAMVRNAA